VGIEDRRFQISEIQGRTVGNTAQEIISKLRLGDVKTPLQGRIP
jgi:hypothetical protein